MVLRFSIPIRFPELVKVRRCTNSVGVSSIQFRRKGKVFTVRHHGTKWAVRRSDGMAGRLDRVFPRRWQAIAYVISELI